MHKLKYFFLQKKLEYCGLNVKFWKQVIIHCPQKVRIGNYSGIGDYVVIWGGGGINIGSNVLIAAHCVITSQGHDITAKIYRKSSTKGPIIIRDNVWLGAGVIVLPNVIIGENAVIGAGSVVTKNIPSNAIAVGSPANVISYRMEDDN